MSRSACALLALWLCAWADAAYEETDFLIRPVALNRRGIVGPGRVCPVNQYAIGFRLKVHAFTAHGDNTALNGIRLACSGGDEAVSAEGPLGQWTEAAKCQSKDDYIVGVKLKSEEWKGWAADDVGALDLEAVCKSGTRLLHKSSQSAQSLRGWWSPEVRCPPEAPAVCGIKSRIDAELLEHETPDTKGDKAMLTEVQLKCCKV